MDENRGIALASDAWPFVEALKLLDRLDGRPPDKGYVLFETGYGPSGTPHIGTFSEVVRTSMVGNAFSVLSETQTRLVVFSDDMDGLRRIPENIPDPERLREHLGKPLTAVPDPWACHESFGHHNNAHLRRFVESFGLDHEFRSATESYRSGLFDAALRKVLENYEAIVDVILPTIGPDRQTTYSPFLPICPKTGRVLQVPLVARDVDADTITYRDEDGNTVTVPVTGGRCKLQWKVDWAMRWVALGVDYEMWGKDLIDSAQLSSRICRILGGPPPEGFAYELFLDERGRKVSKSKGNGLTIDEWLRYGTPESLSFFMYKEPRTAKRLQHFDVIPRNVDEYADLLERFPAQTPLERLSNPVWHTHHGNPPAATQPLSYSVLLHLASACNAEDKDVLWGFISRYVEDATPENSPMLDRLASMAVNYYLDFVKPTKRYRPPDARERAAFADLADVLKTLPTEASAEDIQTEVYDVGKRHGYSNLRDWFRGLYEVLLGQSQGPRIGSFIALYGRAETIELIGRVLADEPVEQAEA